MHTNALILILAGVGALVAAFFISASAAAITLLSTAFVAAALLIDFEVDDEPAQ